MEDGRWYRMYAVLAILHPPSSILVVKNMNVGLEHYLVVSALLFSLGLLGVITTR